MEVFAVLAVALAVMAVGLAVVAAVQLGRQASALRRAVERATARLRPLTEELEAEVAVTSTELEHLQQRAERHAGRTRTTRLH